MKAIEKPFGLRKVEVSLFNDINERIEVVSFDVLSKDFHVLLDFWEICETLLLLGPAIAFYHKSNGSVVKVAKD